MALCRFLMKNAARSVCSRSFYSVGQNESVAHDLAVALKPHLQAEGRSLFYALRLHWLEQTDGLKQLVKEKERQVKREKEIGQILRSIIKETEGVLIRADLDVLKAKGLNDTRGLFEFLTYKLLKKHRMNLELTKGVDLWQTILNRDPSLQTCIEKCTKTPVHRQARLVCDVYDVLSDYVDAGNSLAKLRTSGGTLMFYSRPPLLTNHVEVLTCMGKAVDMSIAEDPMGYCALEGTLSQSNLNQYSYNTREGMMEDATKSPIRRALNTSREINACPISYNSSINHFLCQNTG